jgi:hypothetical protein
LLPGAERCPEGQTVARANRIVELAERLDGAPG